MYFISVLYLFPLLFSKIAGPAMNTAFPNLFTERLWLQTDPYIFYFVFNFCGMPSVICTVFYSDYQLVPAIRESRKSPSKLVRPSNVQQALSILIKWSVRSWSGGSDHHDNAVAGSCGSGESNLTRAWHYVTLDVNDDEWKVVNWGLTKMPSVSSDKMGKLLIGKCLAGLRSMTFSLYILWSWADKLNWQSILVDLINDCTRVVESHGFGSCRPIRVYGMEWRDLNSPANYRLARYIQNVDVHYEACSRMRIYVSPYWADLSEAGPSQHYGMTSCGIDRVNIRIVLIGPKFKDKDQKGCAVYRVSPIYTPGVPIESPPSPEEMPICFKIRQT